MTELSPAERATVERFEQAPDALAEGGCVPCEVCGGSQTRGWHRHESALTEVEREALGWQALGGASPSPLLVRAVERIVAARVTEAADAREAEVRARLSPPVLAMQHGEECDHALGLAEGCSCGLDAAYDAARAAGAAEVRERVEALYGGEPPPVFLSDTPNKIVRATHRDPRLGCDVTESLIRVDDLRAALAPADNDGEAGRG